MKVAYDTGSIIRDEDIVEEMLDNTSLLINKCTDKAKQLGITHRIFSENDIEEVVNVVRNESLGWGAKYDFIASEKFIGDVGSSIFTLLTFTNYLLND